MLHKGHEAVSTRTFAQHGITYATIGLAAALFVLPLAKYHSLHSNFFDLGVFEHLLHRMASTGEWPPALAGHALVYAPAYAGIHRLLPAGAGSYFLVGSQALLLLLPPLYFFRHFGIWVAFAYVAYYPVWTNAHFDFHFDHLAVPLLLGFYAALLRRRAGWAVASARKSVV